MLRKGLVLGALGALFLVPSLAKADIVERPFELTLGAGASHGPDLDGFTASANVNIGYYFTDKLELSLRQTLTYTDLGVTLGGGSAWDGSTRIAFDIHFPMGDKGQIQPFIGGNIGYVYGETLNDSFEAAPEAGIKFYVTNTTFIYLLVEYQFFFDQGDDAGDSFSDGQFLYSAGIGFRF